MTRPSGSRFVFGTTLFAYVELGAFFPGAGDSQSGVAVVPT